MSRYPDERVAELQWLEDGIHFLAAQTFFCITVFALAMIQLCRYGIHVYRNRQS